MTIQTILLTFRKYLGTKWYRYRMNSKLRRAVPVFVYQMGKVGSQSISFSLKKIYKGFVFHSHAMNPNDESLETRLFYKYAINNRKPVKIISLTREPVGKNVSHFFQEFEQHTGAPFSDTRFTIDELKNIFLTKPSVRHTEPLTWFQDNLLKNFDIDVFAAPFPKDKGWVILTQGKAQVLLMKSEIPDDKKELLISSFLNLQNFKLEKANVGEEKNYKETYTKFKREVKLPSSYLDILCNSTYARHFYTDEEIAKARSLWE